MRPIAGEHCLRLADCGLIRACVLLAGVSLFSGCFSHTTAKKSEQPKLVLAETVALNDLPAKAGAPVSDVPPSVSTPDPAPVILDSLVTPTFADVIAPPALHLNANLLE